MGLKKVSDLKPNLKNFEIYVKVLAKDKEKEVFSGRTGITYTVAQATVGDETGIVNLTIWNELIKKIKVGGVYKISNAYTSLFKGYLQLNIGKQGKITPSRKSIEKIKKENDISEIKHQKKYMPYTYKKY